MRYDLGANMQLVYSGPYSQVYRDGDVAVKQVDVDLAMPPHSVRREISLLRKLQHNGIVQFLGVEEKYDDMVIRMKFYQFNLQEYVMHHSRKRTVFGDSLSYVYVNQLSEVVLESIIGSMVRSLKYLHDNGIIHRDIKPQNFLLKDEHSVEAVLCDFSISYDTNEPNPEEPMDQKYHDVCSTYYKPLELLFGLQYGFEVDVWCLGVVISFLYSKSCKAVLWMEEVNDFRLIDKIFAVLGTPSNQEQDVNYWPEIFEVENFQLINLERRQRKPVEELFPRGKTNLELYDKMLCLNPNSRLTITAVEQKWGS